MLKKKVLIIGYGSIGERHTQILSKIVGKKNIFIHSSKKIKNYKYTNDFEEALNFNPDYIVICTPASDHIKKLRLIEKKILGKKILIEKPLFSKAEKFKCKNNIVFVGYNMRFNPIIQTLRRLLINKKFLSANFYCSYYLPYWRKGIKYDESSSASKKLGGGVLLDLSHEIDYIKWIFGNIKNIVKISKKISNLKINTDDYFHLTGSTKYIKHLSIDLNYFSRKKTRRIIINSNQEFIEADLVKAEIIYIYKNTKKIFKFKRYQKNLSYRNQHLAILKKTKQKNLLCSFVEGKKLMKLIDKIRKS